MDSDRFGVVIDWIHRKRQTSSWETIDRMLHNVDFVEEMSTGQWPEDSKDHIDEIVEHSKRLEIEEQYFDRFTNRCRSSGVTSIDILDDLGNRGFQNFLESCKGKGVPDTKYVTESTFNYLSNIHSTFSDEKVSEGLIYSKNPENQDLALFGTMSMAADIGWNVFIVLTDPSEESVSSFISRFSSNLRTNNGTYSWQVIDLSQATSTLIDVFVDSKNDRRYLITLPKKKDRLDVLSRWFDSKKDKASSMRIFAIDETSIPQTNNPEKILASLSKDRALIERTLLNDLLENRGCYRSYLKFVPNVPFELDKACDFKEIMYYDFIEQFHVSGYPPVKEDESRFRNVEDFQRIIERYREESISEAEKGRRFEELIRRYLLTDPTYASQFQWVCLWNDFFARDQLGKHDTGIDLVAKTKSGKYWAVQCKCYAEDYYVTKADMDTFISTSGRTFIDETGEKCGFSYRLVVASTDRFNSNARSVLEGQAIPALILGLHQLANAPVVWNELEKGNMGQGARSRKYQLQKHQQAALECAIKHYSDNDRGKMIMACGTGKTFTSLKITEYLLCDKLCDDKKCTVLFLAPSISLVGQTLREWMGQVSIPVNPICVCSDVSVGRNKIQLDMNEHVEDLGVPSTTDPGAIVLQSMMDGHTFIFSTYQSIDAIIEAQKMGLPEFDVVICDEAHRTTGACSSEDKKSDFNKIHSNNDVKAKKRLYMTATPRIYGEKATKNAEAGSIILYSMDDEKIYGKEFYRISFGEAVEQDLLTDYKVMILTLKESEVPESIPTNLSPGKKEIDADMDTLIWGCLNALAKNVAYDETLKQTDPENMKSAVVFSRTINRSKDIAERFNQIASIPESPIRLEVQHIDGSMNSMERDRKLAWLKEGDKETCHALSNVRCLCEGVDVPALDAVMFMDSKGSLVDVVQSVGRVMRRAPGKKYGYIIIPVLIPADGDAEEALNTNERYKVIWDVLRALRSHDERLDAEINTFQMRKSNTGQHIHIGRLIPPQALPPEGTNEEYVPYFSGQYHLDGFNGKLLARLVLKVGDREYIENWAKDVAKVMPALMEKLKLICTGETYDDEFCNPDFKEYHEALKFCVNENVSEEDAIKMLAQQIVTKPIFEKLFGDQGFVKDNSVSKTIDNMLDKINEDNSLAEIDEQLEDFHKGVERTMSLVDTADGKQKVITALYEKFFKNAFPKDQAINGIVYTPIEIVNFILRSAAEILKQEFDRDINDKGVNILDPFTGTGTFIAQLMESGLITPENLERKYTEEMYANEITLLAYYIAAVNIENTYTRIAGIDGYLPFENILLTDTFNIDEICRRYGTGSQMNLDTDGYFSKNRAIIRREGTKPITLIVGNPPYGASQKSANDNAKKRKYREGIDLKIEQTYLDKSLFEEKANNVNSVYDNYIRAFRWATDRIGDNDGIIAFVTPNGWMTGKAFEGFRKIIEKEFSKIYIFNLRGDGAGIYKEEGDNIFVLGTNRGCKTGIAISLLVKRKNKEGKTQVYYRDIMTMKEGYHVLEKRATVEKCGSFLQMLDQGQLNTIVPKSNGDWLVERNDVFNTLIPLAGDTNNKFEKHNENTIFVGYSNGYKTNRDSWVYNFSKESEETNMSRMIAEYSRQTNNGKIEYIADKIKWNRSLESSSMKKVRISYDSNNLNKSCYRPFTKCWFYNEPRTIDMTYHMPRIYPQGSDNLTICVSGIGVKKDFSCLMTNCPTDLEIVGKSQCFPLYWYDIRDTPSKSNQSKLMGFEYSEPVRHDGISQFAKDEAKKKYNTDISSEDLFFYIYGYLHSPKYRNMFSDDLKLSLPKIGLVDSYDDFIAFSNAGRALSDLHTKYEDVGPYHGVMINGDAPIEAFLGKTDLHRVTKMKLVPEKHRLIYNEYITIDDIPEEAFEYIVNGRSALGWIVDRYQITTDKESGIVNDPNEYAGSTYILNLVLSVINVSVKTMEIVRNLPSIGLDKGAGDDIDG